MRFTLFFKSDERPNFKTRSTRLRRGYRGHASRAIIRRSVSFLVKARTHLVWRTDRTDRDHANRAGRKEKMDQSVAISARAELLHAASRARGATTRHLHRLAAPQNPWRHRRRRVLRDPIDLCPVDAELHLR